MNGLRIWRISSKHGLILRFIAVLLLVQGIQAHLHSTADHPALHDHTSAVELHLGGFMPTDMDDESAGLDIPLFGILKHLSTGLLAPGIIAIFLLPVVTPRRFLRRCDTYIPVERNRYTRKPPLRAPPR